MTHDERMQAVRAELARQDAALEAAWIELAALGEQEFVLPSELITAIDDACASRAPAPYPLGVRA